jgi:hypothetical protein
MCPLQPVKLRISPVNDAQARHGSNDLSLCRITDFEALCFIAREAVSSIAQLCVARAERARALKPFVACCDLIIVIRLYRWERIRVMTISHSRQRSKCECDSRVTPAPFPAGSKNGEGRADDSP